MKKVELNDFVVLKNMQRGTVTEIRPDSYIVNIRTNDSYQSEIVYPNQIHWVFSSMEIKMESFRGKKAKVIYKDGTVIIGKCCDFTDSLDNDPEPADMGIETSYGCIAVEETEIEDILPFEE